MKSTVRHFSKHDDLAPRTAPRCQCAVAAAADSAARLGFPASLGTQSLTSAMIPAEPVYIITNKVQCTIPNSAGSWRSCAIPRHPLSVWPHGPGNPSNPRAGTCGVPQAHAIGKHLRRCSSAPPPTAAQASLSLSRAALAAGWHAQTAPPQPSEGRPSRAPELGPSTAASQQSPQRRHSSHIPPPLPALRLSDQAGAAPPPSLPSISLNFVLKIQGADLIECSNTFSWDIARIKILFITA